MKKETYAISAVGLESSLSVQRTWMGAPSFLQELVCRVQMPVVYPELWKERLNSLAED